MPFRAPTAVPALLLVGFLLASAGCRSADEDMKSVLAIDAQGDPLGVEGALREALERHPDDVDLLLWGAEFYLRGEPEEFYRPRLALHYAMRADKAAEYRSDEVARTFVRAWRGTGGAAGTAEGQALLQQGLELVRHPDAAAPKRLEPVDPDLLDPTIANVIEQARRRRLAAMEPCAAGMEHVPAGTYPGRKGDVEVGAYCVERRSAGGLTQLAADRDAVAGVCRSFGRRACTEAESSVACGPLRTVLGRHPACENERAVRCCAGPRTDAADEPPSP